MAFSSTSRVCAVALLSLGLVGCAGFVQNKVPEEQNAMTELSSALQMSADRAAKARVELTRYRSYGGASDSPQAPRISTTSVIDIDFVGPVEKAIQIIANRLGWEFSVQGKKRADRIVSLRHNGVDAITVLRDIGAQCAKYCNVHADIVEGGMSSVTLKFED